MKILISVVILWCFTASAVPLTEITVIVNADNPTEQLSSSEIRDFYFKKSRKWSDGTPVRFIDRNDTGWVRKIFIRQILKKTASDVDLFWIGQKLYSGDSAPLKESSDGAVLQFVSTFKGAIGYVSPTVNLNSKKVKSIKVELKEE